MAKSYKTPTRDTLYTERGKIVPAPKIQQRAPIEQRPKIEHRMPIAQRPSIEIRPPIAQRPAIERRPPIQEMFVGQNSMDKIAQREKIKQRAKIDGTKGRVRKLNRPGF